MSAFITLRIRSRFVAITCLLLLSAAVPVFSQTSSAGLVGNVHDSSEAVVAGVTVTATQLETGLQRTAQTNSQGDYVLSNLPVGTYSVSASATGFAISTQKNIVLEVGKVLTVNVTLQVGQITQEVEVNATPPQLESRQAALSNIVSTKDVQELPLNGRNPLQLSLLLPGVEPAVNTVYQTSNTLPQQQFVSVSGGRANTILYLLDGGVNQDIYTNVANIYPNPDALQEFSIITNNFSAEYGGRLGGVMNAVTRSGSNQLHGTVFEYVRNDFFNATNFFTPGRGDGLKRNQYGFTFGGPIKKDKLFFFGSWQGTELRQAPVALQAVVPTAAELAGNFAGLANSKGQPIQLVNPATKVPYPNNFINPATFDPTVVKLMKYIPVPTSATGSITVPQINANQDNQFTVKTDYLPSANDHLSVRWIHDQYHVVNAVDPTDILGAQRLPDFHTENAVAYWTHTFSPSVLLTAEGTYNRIESGLSYGYPTTLAGLGSAISNLSVNNDIYMVDSGFFTIPTIAGGHLARNDFQYQGALSWEHGRHELKMGVNFIRQQLNQPSAAYESDGYFTFSSAFTGSNLADFMLGQAASYVQAQPQAEALRMLIADSFIVDNFKVNSKLTLNLGLRWDPFLPWIDARNNEVAQFIPGEQSTVAPGLPPGLVVYGDRGVPQAGYNGKVAEFDPRIGFAYQVTTKTVIRAGGGVYRDNPAGEVNNRITLGPPFDVQLNIQNPPSVTNPFPAASPNPFPISSPPPKNYIFPRPVLGVVYAPDFTNAYSFQQNLTVEHQLSANTLLRLSYMGSEVHRLMANEEINPATFVPGVSTISNINQQRPYYPLGFTSITQFQSNSISNYNAGALTFEKRLSHGVSMLASYTFSKATDMASAVASGGVYGIYTDPANGYYDHGLSDFNRTHRFVASLVYDTPGFQGNRLLHHLAGNWELNAIITGESGLPVNITDGINESLNGVSGTAPDRPNIVGNPSGTWSSLAGEVAQYFNTSAFQLNALGTYGTASRNDVTGPGLFNVDSAMVKSFPIRESLRLQFRAEAFNLFNRVNFDNPVSTLNSPLFGHLTTESNEPSRVLQFALRLTF